MTCRNCRFLDVEPDAAGRRRPQKGRVYPCLAPVPEIPALPASVTEHYLFPKQWPPEKTFMERDYGEGCPAREPIEGKK